MKEFAGYHHPFSEGNSKRKRQRHIINEIKKQVSFYFSDSNLSKDKHLRELISSDKNGYVSLTTIERFGRIADLNCPRQLLTKSISFLPDLKLSEDKLKVKRISPINLDYRADDRTIYIENLPPKMDHKRLEEALSKYGTIMHISLPRFRNNKEFKGFGFIEFKTVDEAKKALKGLGWEGDGDTGKERHKSLTELKVDDSDEDLDTKDEVSLAPFSFVNPPTTLTLLKSEPATPNSGSTPDLTSDGTPDICSETELFKEHREEHQKKKRRRRRSSICLSELKTPDNLGRNWDPLMLVNPPDPHPPHPPDPHPNSARKRKRTSLETASPAGPTKARRVLNTSSTALDSASGPESEAALRARGGVESEAAKHDTSDTELNKKQIIKLAKAKRRKKKKQKMKKKSELQDIRVFPKEMWVQLKVVYKGVQKQQIAAIKKDLGMKPKVEGFTIVKLLGVTREPDDVIRSMFSSSVMSIVRLPNSAVYIRFITNPESYKTVSLPLPLSVVMVDDTEYATVSKIIASHTAKRFVELRKRKKKLRGHTKVIRKCSAKDQTSQDIVL